MKMTLNETEKLFLKALSLCQENNLKANFLTHFHNQSKAIEILSKLSRASPHFMAVLEIHSERVEKTLDDLHFTVKENANFSQDKYSFFVPYFHDHCQILSSFLTLNQYNKVSP